MASVADILQPKFTRSWHEAVALVLEIASRLTPGFGLPAAEDLYIDDVGEVSLGFGSEAPGSVVGELATLLESLLEGTDAPDGLRQLARENATPHPAHAAVDGFVSALAFYERPNRSIDLRAVGSRANGPGQGIPEPELGWLRAKAGAAEPRQEADDFGGAEPPPARTPPPARQTITGWQSAMIGGATAGVVLAGMLALAGVARHVPGVLDRVEDWLSHRVASTLTRLHITAGTAVDLSTRPAASIARPPAPPSDPAEAASGAEVKAGVPEADPAPDPASADPPSTDSAAAVPASTAARTAPPDTRRRAPARKATRVDAFPLLPAADPPAAGTIGKPLPLPLPSTPPSAPAAQPSRERGTYTVADADVTPPNFLRPQLPRRPAPGDETGYFDITVNELGEVDDVTLVSTTHRFEERMLLAAAKAWKFTPARLNGAPVRYRMRIPVIVRGMP